MRRSLAALLFLIALCLPVSAAPAKSPAPDEGTFVKTLARAPQPGADWHVVQDRFGRFSLSLPSDWVEQAPENFGDNYNLVAGESTPRDDFAANLNVVQQEAPDGFTLKPELVGQMASSMKAQMQEYNYVLHDKAFTTIDGVACIVVGGSLQVKGRDLRSLQLRMIWRKVNYLITFTSLEKYYPTYEPLFARLVKGLAFELEQSAEPSPSASASPAK